LFLIKVRLCFKSFPDEGCYILINEIIDAGNENDEDSWFTSQCWRCSTFYMAIRFRVNQLRRHIIGISAVPAFWTVFTTISTRFGGEMLEAITAVIIITIRITLLIKVTWRQGPRYCWAQRIHGTVGTHGTVGFPSVDNFPVYCRSKVEQDEAKFNDVDSWGCHWLIWLGLSLLID